MIIECITETTTFDYRAEGGSLRIDCGQMWTQYGNGHGDGLFSVTVNPERSSGYGSPDGWDFVDCFGVKAGARVTVSAEDWDDSPLCNLTPGRWFVYRKADRSGDMLLQYLDNYGI